MCRDVLKLHETRFADPSQASAVSVGGRGRARCSLLFDLLLRLCHGPYLPSPPLSHELVHCVWPVHLCCVASAGGAEAGAGEQGGQGHGSAHRAGHGWVAWPREGGICVAPVSAVLSLFRTHTHVFFRRVSCTKGFVSYGGFTHVGFPLRTSVSPPHTLSV